MVKCVVLDLDGTLVDTMGMYADKAAELMHEHYGVDVAWARRMYLRTSGLPFIKQLEEIFPGDARNAHVAKAFEDWKKEILQGIELAPEKARALEELRQAGLFVAVSSNNLDVYVRQMTRTWPINAALGYDPERGLAKGEPHFAWLERKLGITRDAMVFVGDSLNDARIAHEARVKFIAVEGIFSTRDFRAQGWDVPVVQDVRAAVNRILQGDFTPRAALGEHG